MTLIAAIWRRIAVQRTGKVSNREEAFLGPPHIRPLSGALWVLVGPFCNGEILCTICVSENTLDFRRHDLGSFKKSKTCTDNYSKNDFSTWCKEHITVQYNQRHSWWTVVAGRFSADSPAAVLYRLRWWAHVKISITRPQKLEKSLAQSTSDGRFSRKDVSIKIRDVHPTRAVTIVVKIEVSSHYYVGSMHALKADFIQEDSPGVIESNHFVFLLKINTHCIIPLCWVTFCIHSGITPVGQFSRKCAKSINQA